MTLWSGNLVLLSLSCVIDLDVNSPSLVLLCQLLLQITSLDHLWLAGRRAKGLQASGNKDTDGLLVGAIFGILDR